MFKGVFNDSIIKKAIDKRIISIRIENIRDYSEDSHRSVDDYPFGGGPGMLMTPQPLAAAIEASKKRLSPHSPTVIYLSAHGKRLDHEIAQNLCTEKSLILLCGRYKGIDQRIAEKYVDREIAIGDYILSGGEIAAMVMVDTITRLLPGTLGNKDSAGDDSFYEGLLSAPEYTRPEEFEGMKVPEVLISGHHRKIREWQEEQARRITQKNRPDLWALYKKKEKN